jgi:tRNA(fMet)-specific endonuclease VapC
VRYALDSNIAIAALNGVASVRRRLADVPASEIGVPVAAIAELTFGAYKSRRTEDNLARIATLKGSVAVLPVNDRVVDLYGSTRASLESRGLVKSDFDLLIASSAIEADAVLVTSDRSLLDGTISGLRTENWLV